MADENKAKNGNSKPKSKPKAEKPKVEKKEKTTSLVDIFKGIMTQGVKDKADAIDKTLEHCKTIGLTKSSKGNDITKEQLGSHFSAITRDIKSGTSNGWHKEYEVVEEEGLLQWAKK